MHDWYGLGLYQGMCWLVISDILLGVCSVLERKKIHTRSDLPAVILFDCFSKMLTQQRECVCVYVYECVLDGKGSKVFASSSTVVLVASSSSKDGCVSDQ